MKNTLFLILISISAFSFSQTDRISSIDYIEVLNGNKIEALFYYQNNWEQLRLQALEKGYINGYQLLETTVTEDVPYSFILITTYKNKAQFYDSETNFQKLIDSGTGLRLINDKKPNEFRKVIMHNSAVKHWN